MKRFEIPEVSGKRIKRYLLQSAMVSACVFMCFMLAQLFANGLLITSVGASAFIAFAFPMAESSKPRYLVGGYACGVVFGIISSLICFACRQNVDEELVLLVVFSILSVFLTTFFMIFLGFQHPPAAALSISLILEENPLLTGAVAMGCIIAICLLRKAVAKFYEKRCAD